MTDHRYYMVGRKDSGQDLYGCTGCEGPVILRDAAETRQHLSDVWYQSMDRDWIGPK